MLICCLLKATNCWVWIFKFEVLRATRSKKEKKKSQKSIKNSFVDNSSSRDVAYAQWVAIAPGSENENCVLKKKKKKDEIISHKKLSKLFSFFSHFNRSWNFKQWNCEFWSRRRRSSKKKEPIPTEDSTTKVQFFYSPRSLLTCFQLQRIFAFSLWLAIKKKEKKS